MATTKLDIPQSEYDMASIINGTLSETWIRMHVLVEVFMFGFQYEYYTASNFN